MKFVFYLLCWVVAIHTAHTAEKPRVLDPRLVQHSWPARWISHHEDDGKSFTVLHFRKEISLASVPDSLWIHVSADSRYRLYVNGQWVSHGPAASDLRHWQFESLDIAPFLQKGKNSITAEVWNFGSQRPMAHMSFETGFILQENDLEKSYGLTTDSSWQVCRNEAYVPMAEWRSYTDIGAAEFVDFAKYPTGWNAHDMTSRTDWQSVRLGSRGATRWSIQNNAGRFLVPRDIPPMRMETIRFASLRKCLGMTGNEQMLQQKTTVVIPKNTKVEWLIDQKELTNAYPVLQLNKGKDALVHIAYAESLYDSAFQKGHRDDIEGKIFRGFQDGLKASGEQISYMPLWYRTFRYVKVTIETKDQPLEMEDFYAIKSEYPFDFRASFDADDPFLDTVLKIGWRTAKLCAMETYMDCPYYERLQYIGDTRIQGLVSLYNSGDDRLLRQALLQFDQSRMAEGITLSRYPTNYDQQIPPFSLWWIGMVHDYWMYRGDKTFVKRLLPGIRQVLTFFEGFQGQDGSLSALPYWNFTDWVNQDGWVFGAPPNAGQGNSALLDLQLLWAYQVAAQLESELGQPAIGAGYDKKVAQLKAVIKKKYWSDEQSLFADEDQHLLFSQHANVLAIMTEMVTGAEARQLMDQILENPALAQTTIYFRYYQILALKKVGYAHRYLDQLDVWRNHVNSGLSTWAEISDTRTTRSDCHAWGASPNIELYRMVLGIESAAPGFSKVKIEPALGKLKQVSGSIPHPKGSLSVNYRQRGDHWDIMVQLPAEVVGTLVWEGKSYPLAAGKQTNLTL